jgi:hypothetical protein
MRASMILLLAASAVIGPLFADEPADSTQVAYTLGYRYLSVGGNEWRFRQYTNPDDGPFVTRLGIHFEEPGDIEEPVWDMSAVVLSPTDLDSYMRWTGGGPMSQVDLYYNAFRFHPETLLYDAEAITLGRAYINESSARRDFGARGTFYWLGTPLELSYRRDTYAGTGLSPAVKYPQTPDFDTRDIRIAKERRLTDWLTLSTEWTERRFSDGTMLQPDSRTREQRYQLTAPLGTNATVRGEYFLANPDLKGASGVDYSSGGIVLDAAWDSGFGLQAYASRAGIDNDVTLTGYTKNVRRTGLKVSYVGPRAISLRGGVELRSFDQELAGSGTSGSEPDKTYYWASLSARPAKDMRLRAKYRAWDVSGLSAGADGSIPDKRTRGEVEIRVAPWERMALSLTGARDERENPFVGIDCRMTTYGATLWTQLSDQVSFFGHYCSYDWDSDSDPELVGAALSDAVVWGGYVQITPAGRGYISLGYEQSRSDRAADNRDQSVTLGFGWSAGSDNSYSIEYRHQKFDDWVMTSSAFEANVVSVSGTFRY